MAGQGRAAQGSDMPGGARWLRARWRVVAAVGAAVAVVAVLVTVLLTRDGDEATTTQATPTSAPSSTTSSTSDTTTTTAAPSTTTAQANEPAGPTAADALDGFFSAATTMDGQLHAAATAINSAGPPWPSVSEQVASTVRAAELAPVAEAIPAGLPHDLLQSVILVYSDLASRRFAMASFASARAPGEPTYSDMLEELGNGHEAAERFDGDLAAARALAATLPPVTTAAPDSRATAELMLLLDYVSGANGGCDSRGGIVIDELPTITWTSDTGGTVDATYSDVQFEATLGPDGTWTAFINAC